MSQFQPIVERAAKSINALPLTAIKGHIKHPFAIIFTGLWSYSAKLNVWRPKMLCHRILPGLQGGEPGNPGAKLSDMASKSTSRRVFLNGDRRLGSFAGFLTSYPVRLKSGNVAAHYALACETYHVDAIGRIVRKIDQEWLEGLSSHVVKNGLVLPPLRADLDAATSRVTGQIARIDDKMTVRGAARDELEIRRAGLVTLREKMIASFDKQFPDADKLSGDLADVTFSNEAPASHDVIVEDDDAPM